MSAQTDLQMYRLASRSECIDWTNIFYTWEDICNF